MIRVKVTTVGSSVGVILPAEARRRLDVRKGDTLYLTEAPGGGWRLTAEDPEFERQMELAEEVMREDRDVLAALAKR